MSIKIINHITGRQQGNTKALAHRACIEVLDKYKNDGVVKVLLLTANSHVGRESITNAIEALSASPAPNPTPLAEVIYRTHAQFNNLSDEELATFDVIVFDDLCITNGKYMRTVVDKLDGLDASVIAGASIDTFYGLDGSESDVLMSDTNLDGWKLEKLTAKLNEEMDVKNSKLTSDDCTLEDVVRNRILENNKLIQAKLTEIEAIQEESIALLTK